MSMYQIPASMREALITCERQYLQAVALQGTAWAVAR